MGNTPSSSSRSSSKRKSKRRESSDYVEQTKKVVGEVQASLKESMKRLEESENPAAQFLDTVCGPLMDTRRSFDEDDEEEEFSEDETTTTTDYRSRRGRRHEEDTVDDSTYYTEGTESDSATRNNKSYSEDEKLPAAARSKQPLASSFARRCYFTKAGIGPNAQHYEGLTLTGNVVLMLAAAMKLKGCPTICDEDLRRVEQTYPNQFSRLPDELLLSSGWRRISKYCHFSNKPIPDGVPFFHSKQRMHPLGGYYFLLASAVGMARPIDVEPLNRDTLVLLETDYPATCDAAPPVLIQDPKQWTLVDKFCFFSGGPINTDEDVYYQADFDGNPIYMLAFLSPSLTPRELYKLDSHVGLETVEQVHEVESVYDLTHRDFEDLKLYHLGPCRALPSYILTPEAWLKVLPPHFLIARQQAMLRARDYQGQEDDYVPSDIAAHEEPWSDPVPMDEAVSRRLDPPDEFDDQEPPSLSKRTYDSDEYYVAPQIEEVASPVSEDISPSIIEEEEPPRNYRNGLPPLSPGSDVSQSNPALRDAQELIRRNRLKRQQEQHQQQEEVPTSPDSESGATWESSELSNEGNTSSVWTDNSQQDRSSRRQLILQMAKARMKRKPTAAESNNKEEEEKKVGEDIDLVVGDLD